MSELKPCPFCQSVPKVGGGMLVHPICDCYGDVYIEWDTWQTRPLEDALQKRVEELEKLSNAHKKLACLVDQQQIDLRASISEAVKEIEGNIAYLNDLQAEYQYEKKDATEINYRKRTWILALNILRKHGLIGGE